MQQVAQQAALHIGHGAAADDHGHDDEVVQKRHQVLVQPPVQGFTKGSVIIGVASADDVRAHGGQNTNREKRNEGKKQAQIAVGREIDCDIGAGYQRRAQQCAEPHCCHFKGNGQ